MVDGGATELNKLPIDWQIETIKTSSVCLTDLYV